MSGTPSSEHSAVANQPRVSVLLPVHNGAEYVAEAVDSILTQTFQDFELLIIDDGSTDRTLSILEEIGKRDSRIRLTSRSNKGLISTLNELIAQSRGELLARMDADDVSLPDRLDQQVAFLDANPTVVCVGGATMMIDSRGRFLTTLYPPEGDEPIQAAAIAGHGSICHPAAMMRRSAVEAIGGYDPGYAAAEDLDLFLRLGEVGHLANLKAPLLKYRLHDKSVSEVAGQLQRESARKACEAAWRRRGVQGVFTATERWRPEASSSSREKFMLQYGWWAWNSGERWTALGYGVSAVKERVGSLAAWKLLLVSLAKKRPSLSLKKSSCTGGMKPPPTSANPSAR